MGTADMNLEAGLHRRYGADAPDVGGEAGGGFADAVLACLLAHKSVRQYQAKLLPPGTLERLAAAGQSAATSSNLQTWSVIALQEPGHKVEASVLCGDQEFIRQAPLFLVFCADFWRDWRLFPSRRDCPARDWIIWKCS